MDKFTKILEVLMTVGSIIGAPLLLLLDFDKDHSKSVAIFITYIVVLGCTVIIWFAAKYIEKEMEDHYER